MDSQPQPSPQAVPENGGKSGRIGSIQALQTVISVAILIATLFTIWTPASLFSSSLSQKMSLALQPKITPLVSQLTPTVAPQTRIGIVSGHWGNDSGATCPDGLTEADVNLKIATLVRTNLINAGYTVDLLREFDPKLFQYQALALVSIHNDSCAYINDEATGFKVAAALATSPFPDKENRLTACLIDRYAKDTGMKFHYNSITKDMTEYHAFEEVNTSTTAAIIETGFLNLDRQILTEHTDQVARGISDGILCYVRNETIQPDATPTPKP